MTTKDVMTINLPVQRGGTEICSCGSCVHYAEADNVCEAIVPKWAIDYRPHRIMSGLDSGYCSVFAELERSEALLARRRAARASLESSMACKEKTK